MTTLPGGQTRTTKGPKIQGFTASMKNKSSLGELPEVSREYLYKAGITPADMRSFMRSYFDATDSNTPRTRRAFSSGGTRSKPKSVVSLISLRVLRDRSQW